MSWQTVQLKYVLNKYKTFKRGIRLFWICFDSYHDKFLSLSVLKPPGPFCIRMTRLLTALIRNLTSCQLPLLLRPKKSVPSLRFHNPPSRKLHKWVKWGDDYCDLKKREKVRPLYCFCFNEYFKVSSKMSILKLWNQCFSLVMWTAKVQSLTVWHDSLKMLLMLLGLYRENIRETVLAYGLLCCPAAHAASNRN